MRKKYAIQVRNGDGSVVETIFRALRQESIGNFAPLFCSYKGNKRCLVESDSLDLDDPTRCVEEDHIGHMFIRPRNKKTGAVVNTWGEL